MTDTYSLLTLALIGATFVLAGAAKGLVGLGLPTVVVGLLGQVMAPAEAAALMVVPSLLTNLWQTAAGPALGHLLARLWPFLVAIVAGTAGVGAMLPEAAGPWAGRALGAALLAYAAFGLWGPRLRIGAKADAAVGPLAGLAAGAVTAATGVAVMPTVPYLQALGLEKDDLVQALGLAFTVSTVTLGGVLLGGALDGPTAAVSAGAVVPAVAGMMLGQRLRRRVDGVRFRLAFFAALAILGARLLLVA